MTVVGETEPASPNTTTLIQQKRMFAKYVDDVQDQADISGTSRFMSGGIGGIASQLSIYPVETLKTQLQSSTGPVKGNKVLIATARHMWRTGGMRAYYRGLTVSVDKKAMTRSTG